MIMDLGTKQKNLGEPVSAATPKISYPSFTLNDEAAEKLVEACDCAVGDEITATVTLKVTYLRKDTYGNSLGLDVRKLNDPVVATNEGDGSDETGEPTEEDKSEAETDMLGYKRPASKPKNEVPKFDASELD